MGALHRLSRKDQRLALELIRSLTPLELENLQRMGSVNHSKWLQLGHLEEEYASREWMMPQKEWQRPQLNHSVGGGAGVYGRFIVWRRDRVSTTTAYLCNHPIDYERGVFTPLASEIQALPDFNNLRARMVSAAVEAGLSNPRISVECVYLLSAATEVCFTRRQSTHAPIQCFLKNILSDCIVKTQPLPWSMDANGGSLVQAVKLPGNHTMDGLSTVRSTTGSPTQSMNSTPMVSPVKRSAVSSVATPGLVGASRIQAASPHVQPTSQHAPTNSPGIRLRDLYFSMSVSRYLLSEHAEVLEQIQGMLGDEQEDWDEDA